jgi:hypothetical protein
MNSPPSLCYMSQNHPHLHNYKRPID